ncbi:MAG: response regulator transcription factor [SAR324 cluster bacterium]|nr:response regulator transcription factor [SAR324 cluster bacterium]
MLYGYLMYMMINLHLENRKSKIESKQANDAAIKWQEELKEVVQGISRSIELQFEKWELSRAEKEISIQLLTGLSFKEISHDRSTSERTVRQQATAIYKKANVNGRIEFSAFFLKGLLKPIAHQKDKTEATDFSATNLACIIELANIQEKTDMINYFQLCVV